MPVPTPALMGTIWSSHRTSGPQFGRSLFTWGYNANGALGDGTTASKSSPVPIGAATNWSAIAAGGGISATNLSLGIRGGALFAWGGNGQGQLGDGTTASKSSPVPIGAVTTWTAIAAAGANSSTFGFSLGISGGALFAWGSNNYGQLGNGAIANKSSPVPIGAATNWTAVAAAIGGSQGFSLGISGGALFAWGGNAGGKLGDGTVTSKSSPVPIGAVTTWTAIAAGGGSSAYGFSLGISGGALFAWGYNSVGQLGNGAIANKSSPVPIGAATNWTVVAAAGNSNVGGFSLGISGGALFAWGANNYGQLGNGAIANKSSPVPIGAATNWTAVAAAAGSTNGSAYGHSLGIRGGALFAWGYNGGGCLGDGTVTSKSSPVPIGAVTTWSAVAGAGGKAGFSVGLAAHGAQTFSTTTTWTAPSGVTSVTSECWGAGGGGGGGLNSGTVNGGGGGGGGGYSKQTGITVVPGTAYTVTVGVGGAVSIGDGSAGQTGGDSWFKTSGTVLAKGGGGGPADSSAGIGGASGSGIGGTKFSGGNGGASTNTNVGGSGGGSSAGNAAGGNNGVGSTINTGGAGGAAVTAGGAGGAGANLAGSSVSGSAPGGGGGGLDKLGVGGPGGAGAAGQVILSW